MMLEAGALGVPVMASAVDGMRDLIEPGEDGLLFAPEDVGSIQQALTQALNAEGRVAMGERFQRKIREQYSARHEATLVGRGKDSGKVKYANDAGKTIYEIKPSDDGFKLRTAEGKLLWKVKFYDAKVKVSDNEENLNPWQLKSNGVDRIKVEHADRKVGSVKFYADTRKVKLKDADGQELYQINDATLSFAFGAGFIEMPKDQQGVLMLELLKRR